MKEENTNGKDFSFDGIKDFDKHIDQSIPYYSELSGMIKSLATYFIVLNSNVYDLGCSTGMLLRDMYINTKASNVNFFGYDISDNLLNKIRTDNAIHLIKRDITDPQLKLDNASLITSVFTIQFLPEEYRRKIIQKVYDNLNAGGAFIMAEKTISDDARLQDILTFSYYDFKEKAFQPNEILDKQRVLRSIMKPAKSTENEAYLQEAGFRVYDVFWQSYQFKAWLCIKL